MSCDGFGGNFTFMRGFVCQHRIADDIADREDMANVCAALFVYRNKTAFVDVYARFVGVD